MEIEAESEEAVFADALQALGELVGNGGGGQRVLREVVLDDPERSALLVRWLDELVYLAETEDLVPEHAERIELGRDRLRASGRCCRGNPRHMVEAATYHRLEFEPSKAGFRARVVFDV